MYNLEENDYEKQGELFTTFCDAFKDSQAIIFDDKFFGIPMEGKWMRKEGTKLTWFASAFMLFRWRRREELSWRSHVIKATGKVIFLPVWCGSDLLWTTDMKM